MKNKFYLVSGNKGGVGKSFMAINLTDFLVRRNNNVQIADCESASNQNTFLLSISKSYKNLPTYIWSLSEDRGFAEMADTLYEQREKNDVMTVVDTGASLLPQLINNLELLNALANEGNTSVTVLFVVGPDTDSATAAKTYLHQAINFPWIKTVFIFNAFLSESKNVESFVLHGDDATIKTIKENRNTEMVFFPHIDERFRALIMSGKLLGTAKDDPEIRFGTKKQFLQLAVKLDPIFEKMVTAFDTDTGNGGNEETAESSADLS